MNDMSKVIIPKSDQINAEHLLAGPMDITITEVTIRPGTEQPVSIHFEGDNNKPYKPCKSMCKVMVYCWGADANQYVGRSMTLYCDPKVKWGGLAVGGIRISHMSHINGAVKMALTETKGSRKPFTVEPFAPPAPAPKAAPPAPDAALEMARAMVAQIDAANEAALKVITADSTFRDQLAGFRENRPKLATRVDAAINAAMARFEGDICSDLSEGETV